MGHSTELVQTAVPQQKKYLKKTMKYSDLTYLLSLCNDLLKPKALNVIVISLIYTKSSFIGYFVLGGGCPKPLPLNLNSYE